MRELALHVLDVMENAVRAQATTIRVAIRLNLQEDRLELSIEDNGPGLPVTPEQALNPFYTTKAGKRTGLGLSLFQSAAQLAKGALHIDRSDLGGVAVTAVFQYSHVDRMPLGDMASTLMTAVMSSPEITFLCRIEGPQGAVALNSVDFHPEQNAVRASFKFAEAVSAALVEAGIGQ